MRVSNSRQLSSTHSNIKLWETIDRIQKVLQISDEAYADLLELTLPEFFKLKSSCTALSAHSFYSLNGRLNLSSEKMYRGDIDYIALDRSWRGDQFYIPERYSVSAQSRTVTVNAYLTEFSNCYGFENYVNILRHFQMPPSFFADPNRKVNIQFVMDLTSKMHFLGVSDSFFNSIGFASLLATTCTELGKLCTKAGSVVEVFELYFSSVPRFLEKNAIHRILYLDSNRCRFEVQSNPDICESLGILKVGNPHICRIREGVSLAISQYIGMSSFSSKEYECQFDGADACRFEVLFRQP